MPRVSEISVPKGAKAATRRKQTLYSAVLHSLRDHVAIVDRNGLILEVNEAWYRFAENAGLSRTKVPWLRRNYLDACRRTARDVYDGIKAVLEGKKELFQIEYACATPLKVLWFEMTVEPLRRPSGGAVISHNEITARKETEAEVRSLRDQAAHMMRINAVGELAGTLAHELTQPLTAILSSTQAARRYLERTANVPAEVNELLEMVVAQDKRAGEIIRDLRGMMRQHERKDEPLEMNDLVGDTLRFVNSDLIARRVTVRTRLSASLPSLRGDRIQLQQVLLNLLLNGCDAMKDNPKSRRRLLIETRQQDPKRLCVRISDLGPGIPADLLPDLFTPFKTTKKQGLGLGLSICRSIVNAHRGELKATNNPTGGATFSLLLPILTTDEP